MPQHELPPLVLAFLAEHVSSLEQFQVLLRVVQSGDRWWDAESASREVGLSRRDAMTALDHLARHNLLDIRITGEVRYQFRPGTSALLSAAQATVEEFRRWPDQVLDVITRRKRHGLRDFSDAFRIRRDDDR